MRVNTKGIGYVCLYKLLLIGYVMIWFVLGVVYGGFSLFGYHAISIHGSYVLGWYGLICGLALGPLTGFVFATMHWLLLSPGLWLYTRFFNVELTYRETDKA